MADKTQPATEQAKTRYELLAELDGHITPAEAEKRDKELRAQIVADSERRASIAASETVAASKAVPKKDAAVSKPDAEQA